MERIKHRVSCTSFWWPFFVEFMSNVFVSWCIASLFFFVQYLWMALLNIYWLQLYRQTKKILQWYFMELKGKHRKNDLDEWEYNRLTICNRLLSGIECEVFFNMSFFYVQIISKNAFTLKRFIYNKKYAVIKKRKKRDLKRW